MTWAARRTALISVTGVLIAGAAALTTGTAGQAAAQTPGAAPPSAVSQIMGTQIMGQAAAAVSGHAAAITLGQQAGVQRYWTRVRMEHAIPLDPSGSPVAGQSARPSAGQGSQGVAWQRARFTGTAAADSAPG